MKILYYEIKLILSKIHIILFSFLLLISVIFLGVKSVDYIANKKELVKHFVVGVVDYDDSKYFNLIFNMFNSNEMAKDIVTLEKMDIAKADSMIEKNNIAAYIIIPKGFTNSILNGDNIPLDLVLNKAMPIEAGVVKLVADTGSTFLISSQSGIYATIDQAYKLGFNDDFVNNKVVFPINLAYAKLLLNHQKYFNTNHLFFGNNAEIGFRDFFIRTLVLFIILVWSSIWYGIIKKHLTKDILSMYSIAKFSSAKIILLKYLSIFIILSIIFIPLIWEFKFYYLFITSFVSTFILFTSIWFDSRVNANLFILLFSISCLFFSGSIIPLSLMPNLIQNIAYLTPNYHIINIESNYLFLLLMTCFILVCSFIRLNTRRLNK